MMATGKQRTIPKYPKSELLRNTNSKANLTSKSLQSLLKPHFFLAASDALVCTTNDKKVKTSQSMKAKKSIGYNIYLLYSTDFLGTVLALFHLFP